MKKIMMAIAPLLILTSCANQASLAKLNKFALNLQPNQNVILFISTLENQINITIIKQTSI